MPRRVGGALSHPAGVGGGSEVDVRRVLERLAALLIGLLVVWILVEAGTRLATRVVYPRSDPTRAVAGLPEGAPRVLTMGDSFTAGRVDASWPRAFAEIERARRGRPVAVVNGGMGGLNSRMVLEALPAFLRTARPHLVLICAGSVNLTNWYGFNAWAGRDSPASRLDDALAAHLASWRLVRHLAVAWARTPTVHPAEAVDGYATWQATFRRNDRPVPEVTSDDPDFRAARVLLDAGRAVEAYPAFLAAARARPDVAVLWWGTAMAAAYTGDQPGAVQAYEACLAASPGDAACTFGLGMVLSDTPGGIDRAEVVLTEGVARWPDDPLLRWALGRLHGLRARQDQAFEQLQACIRLDPDRYYCYETLVGMVRGPRYQGEVRRFLEEVAPRSAMARDTLAALLIPGPGNRARDVALLAWARDDVAAMVTLCLERGARVLLHSYPEENPVNDVLREVAATRGVPFVDHVPAFRAALTTTLRSDLFVPDGHPNDEGYRRMAEAIADAVDTGGLLPAP